MSAIETPPLYLDTSHISQLVRHPDSDESRAVLAILESGEVPLAVTLLHFHELSAPQFKSRPAVGALLDSLSLAWGRWVTAIFHDEVEAVIAQSFGLKRLVTPFVDSMEAAWNMPKEAVLPPSEALEAMADTPSLREGMRESLEEAAALDALLKTEAAVIKDPVQPLIARFREEHDLTRTPSGLELLEPLDPEAILKDAGGIRSLPAYHTFQSLGITRLGDPGFPTDANDVMDDLHACYGAYSAALLVDRSTLGRLCAAKVPFLDRCGRRLEDVPTLLSL